MSIIFIIVCLGSVLWVFLHKWSDRTWLNWTLKILIGFVSIFAVIILLAALASRREHNQRMMEQA